MNKQICGGLIALIFCCVFSGCATHQAVLSGNVAKIDGAKILEENQQAKLASSNEIESSEGEHKMQVEFKTSKGDIVIELDNAATRFFTALSLIL